MHNIMQLANKAGLEEFDDVEEPLHPHGEDLTNEELEKQKAVEAEDDDTEEAPPTWNLTTAMLTDGIARIIEVQEMFQRMTWIWSVAML